MHTYKLLTLALAATATLTLTGCVTGEAIKTSNDTYAATIPDRVQVLFEKPTRPYEVLGQVTSKGAPASSQAANIKMLQTQAAKLGANAVLIQGGGVQEVQQWGDWNHKASSALALRWK